MAHIDPLLDQISHRCASSALLQDGRPILITVAGQNQEGKSFTVSQISILLREIVPPNLVQDFMSGAPFNFIYAFNGHKYAFTGVVTSKTAEVKVVPVDKAGSELLSSVPLDHGPQVGTVPCTAHPERSSADIFAKTPAPLILKGASTQAGSKLSVEKEHLHTQIVIVRKSQQVNKLRSIKIYIDGRMVGKIKDGETASFSTTPGRHTIQAKLDWCSSSLFQVDILHNQTRKLSLGSPAKADLTSSSVFVYIAAKPQDYLELSNEE